ncbi:MAG: hypothetical protein M0P39_16220 [Rhodocyclaceae bacterium]|nr:hypothetical protein [Rhodocyclaceae bacterium]
MKKTIAVVALLYSALPPALAADDIEIGRLFFTPERRANLDRQRQLNIQETQTLEGSTMSLDGIVRRSGGKQTVWVNGRAQNDTGTTGVVVGSRGARPGEAVLSAGGEAPAELKVGESINRATRERNDKLGGGRVTVAKPALRP